MIVASIIGGVLVTRTSYRNLTVTGLLLATAGVYLLTRFSVSVGWYQMLEAVAVTGFGVGMTFSSTFLAIQNSASRAQIGIASSLPQFMGNLGGTIGLAIMGTIQANTFASKLAGVLATVPAQSQATAIQYLGNANLAGQFLASPQALQQFLQQYPAFASIIPQLRLAFVESITPLFTIGLVIAVASVAASFMFNGSMKQQMLARKMAMEASKKEGEEMPTAAPI